MNEFLLKYGIMIDLVDYLIYKGCYIVKCADRYEVKSCPLQLVSGDLSSLSIYPDRQGWKRWSDGTHGGNVLDFCRMVLGMTFQQAVRELGGSQPHIEQVPEMNVRQSSESVLRLPERYQGTPSRLYAYLIQTRNIAPEIVRSLLYDGSIYQDVRGNVVFVGRDQQQQARFACLRGTYSAVSFKKECPGSDKRFSFSVAGADRERLYIFESPIDLLSAGTLANRIRRSPIEWRRNSRLSLAGLSDAALAHYLTVHPSFEELHFWLDNDGAGRQAALTLCRKYSKAGFRCYNHCPRNKDMNEDLSFFLKQ